MQVLLEHGWVPIIIDDIPVLDATNSTENFIFNSHKSKILKVYPQRFLPKNYDLIVWFDNKNDLVIKNVINQVYNWNPNTAIMMHRYRPNLYLVILYNFNNDMALLGNHSTVVILLTNSKKLCCKKGI